MSDGVPVAFTGTLPQPVTSGLLTFPGGFRFHYGLATYSTFSVSPHGFIRLGSNVENDIPQLQSDVIAPLNNPTIWDVSYKITGSLPDRKMVFEWEGVMQPSGERTDRENRVCVRRAYWTAKFIFDQHVQYFLPGVNFESNFTGMHHSFTLECCAPDELYGLNW